jgi:hypothetical protein
MGAQASRLHDCPQPQRGGTNHSPGQCPGLPHQNAPLARVNWGAPSPSPHPSPRALPWEMLGAAPLGLFLFGLPIPRALPWAILGSPLWGFGLRGAPNTQGVALGYIRAAPLGRRSSLRRKRRAQPCSGCAHSAAPKGRNSRPRLRAATSNPPPLRLYCAYVAPLRGAGRGEVAIRQFRFVSLPVIHVIPPSRERG